MNFIESALVVAVSLSTPLMLAALGELIAERAGILNLSIEGMMLMGASLGFAVGFTTESLNLAVLAGMVAGASLSLVHAFVSITLKVNQIVSGLTLVMLGTGLAAFIGSKYAGATSPVEVKTIPIPLLSEIPFLGPILFNQDLLVYISVPLVVFASWFLFNTTWGQWVRATGEAPAAADAAGVPVTLVRYAATLTGGALAGLAGTYFSVVFARAWTENMIAGRGWIALALVIFATWRPLLLLPGALFFGFLDSLNFQLQAAGFKISTDFLGMMPYVLTLLVLIVVWRRQQVQHRGMPRALGVPYEREKRE